FHNTTQMQRAVITHSNFTYRIVLRIVDKYLQNALRVVDVGCGSGVLSFYIASKRIRVLGTDVSSLAIRSCVQSADYLGLKDWTEFRCASFLDDNLGAERFDLAICSEVIEHLPDDRLAVQRLTHLLMPGGLLILSTPSARAPIHLFRMRLWGKDGCDERVGHLRRYALEDLVALIEEAGFKIIERKRTEGMIRNFFFVTPIGNKLLRFVRWKMADLISWLDEMTIDFLGESQLIVVARKKSF
ncbi:methyltransferase domain-containing protein, partial [Candidatus Woesearchaeota archaeon]|nr:methyltransferase domain-containing protein [Candidatus Woesearchaeota archaeon]